MTGFAIFSLAALAAAAGASGGSLQPLHLKVQAAGDQVVIEVVGSSAVACEVTYELEVSSGPGNRSVNRGRAAIESAKPLTIATVRTTGAAVTARLNVQGCGGSYSESWPKPA